MSISFKLFISLTIPLALLLGDREQRSEIGQINR
jgi:hypothetical protein